MSITKKFTEQSSFARIQLSAIHEKITEQSSFASSQLSVIHKQFSETIKLSNQPAECHSQTIFRNNQALQAATKEFRIWIRIVIRKQFTEQSNFARSQQRIQCMEKEFPRTFKLCNQPAESSVHRLSVVAHKEFTEQKWCKQPAWSSSVHGGKQKDFVWRPCYNSSAMIFFFLCVCTYYNPRAPSGVKPCPASK